MSFLNLNTGSAYVIRVMMSFRASTIPEEIRHALTHWDIVAGTRSQCGQVINTAEGDIEMNKRNQGFGAFDVPFLGQSKEEKEADAEQVPFIQHILVTTGYFANMAFVESCPLWGISCIVLKKVMLPMTGVAAGILHYGSAGYS